MKEGWNVPLAQGEQLALHARRVETHASPMATRSVPLACVSAMRSRLRYCAGVHAPRFLGVAIVDVLATLAVAACTSWRFARLPARGARGKIDIVVADRYVGDDFELRTMPDQVGIDAIGNSWHQHITIGHTIGKLRARHRRVVGIE